MPIPELGNLEAVPVGSVWNHESQEFTPWLAENLHLLGNAIGLSLDLVQTEAYKFGGYADILAEDDSGNTVIVENQLGATDDDHFVRILKYGADHEARVIIWVAPEFTDAHTRALNWLNRACEGNTEIYAVEVSAVRIGASSPAPVFKSVIEPNGRLDRSKSESPTGSINRHTYYSAFYTPLNERLMDRGIGAISPRNGGWVSRYRTYPSDLDGMFYMLIHDANDDLATVGFRVTAHKRSIFDALYEDKEQIERELTGISLDWYEDWDIPGICATTEAHFGDPDHLQERTRQWMFDNLLRLREVIEPRLQTIVGSNQTETASPEDLEIPENNIKEPP